MIVQSQNLNKKFGEFTAVKGATFDIPKGECFGLLGPNGAGKSTIINMLYGVAKRTAGSLQVFGMDPNTQAREIKRRLGVVTQENALDESLTVKENMLLYAAFVGLEKSKREERVNSLLNYMQLDSKSGGPIAALSGGMKRRLVFVRALLNAPEFVILDEPTTGLDPAVRHLLWAKVRELKSEGKTVLLTTHYMHEAEVLCDRIVIMNQGEVIDNGSPRHLIEKYVPGFVATFDPVKLDLQRLKSLVAEKTNWKTVEDDSGLYLRAPTLNDLLEFQKSANVHSAMIRPSNLEDVFLNLTGKGLAPNA